MRIILQICGLLALYLCVLCGGLRAEEAKEILRVSFDAALNLQGSGGVVETLPDGKPALVLRNVEKSRLLFFWLKKEQCEGRLLKFRIQAKTQSLSKAFIFGLQAKRNGADVWPAGSGGLDTCDWKEYSFTADFPALGITAAAIRLGLQQTTGTVYFRDLIVEDLGPSPSASAAASGAGSRFSGRYGSVDFSANQFHVPDYSASRNLIQNPSFEEGADFWATSCWGELDKLPDDGKPLLFLDATTAAEGKTSLCQRVAESGKGGWPPATFAIPVEEGQDYTLTFYAKTDNPSNAKFTIGGVTDVWDNFLPRVRYRLSTDWTRYTYQFKSTKKMVSIFFGTEHAKTYEPFRIWLDAVQLEKGTKATEFTRPAAAVRLATATSDNLSQPGEAVNARLQVSTRQPAEGVVSYQLRDFFGKVVDEGKLPFKSTVADVPVELPIPACDKLDSGAYVLQADLKLADGFAYSTWHRLMRMHYLDGSHKHRVQFSGAGINGEGNWNGALQLMKRMGVGSFCIFNTPPAQYQQLLKQNGMLYFSMAFQFSGWPPTILGKYSFDSSASDKSKGMGAITDADIPAIVGHAIETIKANPDCLNFKTLNEPFMHTEEDIAKVAKIQTALRKEAKKINPNIRIMTPDCANIDHTLLYLDTLLRNGGPEVCDIVALHTYRGHPDAIDGDLQKIIALTDTYKPGAEIWSTEGGYYNTYIIPDVGFPRVTQGGDHFRAGNISYDLGLGERIATAYETRYRIQSLKHAARVKVDVDWNLIGGSRTYFGLDMIPTATAFAVNTPARLLGNADFVADLKLPKEMRGYLFKDEQNRPVVAMWFTNDDTLYKGLAPAKMAFGKLAGTCEVIDQVGATIQPGKELAIAGYPVFMRGRPGKTEEMLHAVESAAFTFPEVGDALGHTFTFRADGTFTAAFSNRFNRPLQGVLVCTVSGKEVVRESLSLKPYETLEKALTFPKAAQTLQKVPYRYAFTPETGAAIIVDQDILYFEARKAAKTFALDGDARKWDNIPAIALDNLRLATADNPFSVQTKWAWNENTLFCSFDVKDPAFRPSKSIQFPLEGDSVEFFLDSFADSVRKGHTDYAEDDQSYYLWLNERGGVDLYRRQVPNLQLAFTTPGHVGGAKAAFSPAAQGYHFEAALPAREVKPIDLRDGGSFGLNVLAREYGDNRKVSTAMFGGGEIPVSWRAPKNYVFVFLRAD